jgi:hypothetical protein
MVAHCSRSQGPHLIAIRFDKLGDSVLRCRTGPAIPGVLQSAVAAVLCGRIERAANMRLFGYEAGPRSESKAIRRSVRKDDSSTSTIAHRR